MADEENKNSSAADSILAETADLYKEDIVQEEEIPAEEPVKEEPKEPEKEKKVKKKVKKEVKEEPKAEPKEEEKEEKPAAESKTDVDLDEVFGDIKDDETEDVPAEEVPAKSAAIVAIEAKEAAKLQKKNEREQKQAAKRNAKRARLQALIDQCPNEYKPVSTSKFFWYGVLCNLPGLGFIITILFSIFPVNKNVKNFARSILIVYLIGIILNLILMIVLFFMTPNDVKSEILQGVDKIMHSFR
ncbi:MAG: hypothetical protein K6A80_11110 [Saccharofermentans sp.]|nr:hypothetical protein [Saccharofermentans sp.]